MSTVTKPESIASEIEKLLEQPAAATPTSTTSAAAPESSLKKDL
jgi:hypothetical protein